MFEVTDKASEMIRELLAGREEPVSAIRIIVSEGGWSGATVGMALDEPEENDEKFEKDGLSFVINKQLLEDIKPVKVDFLETDNGSGFYISSGLSGCGTCSCWQRIFSGEGGAEPPLFFIRLLRTSGYRIPDIGKDRSYRVEHHTYQSYYFRNFYVHRLTSW